MTKASTPWSPTADAGPGETRTIMVELGRLTQGRPLTGEAELSCERTWMIAEFLVAVCDVSGTPSQMMRNSATLRSALAACAEQGAHISEIILAAKSAPSARLDERLRDAVGHLHREHESVRDACRQVADALPDKTGNDHQDLVDACRLHVMELGAKAIVDDDRLAERRSQQADDGLRRIEESVREATDGRRRIDELVEGATEIVTEAAESTLAGHFTRHAEHERARADKFLSAAAAILALLSAAVITLTLVFRDFTPASIVVKIAAGVPLALLAGYLLRESARHRTSSRSASELAVRLHAIRAFADLEPEDRQSLRNEFGKLVFLGATPDPVPSAPAESPAPEAGDTNASNDVVALLRRLVDLVADLGSRRSTT